MIAWGAADAAVISASRRRSRLGRSLKIEVLFTNSSLLWRLKLQALSLVYNTNHGVSGVEIPLAFLRQLPVLEPKGARLLSDKIPVARAQCTLQRITFVSLRGCVISISATQDRTLPATL